MGIKKEEDGDEDNNKKEDDEDGKDEDDDEAVAIERVSDKSKNVFVKVNCPIEELKKAIVGGK